MTPLHTETVGAGPVVVLAHGFTQTGRLWGPFGEILARDHTLVRVDLPGHAGSGAVSADLVAAAGLVVDAVDGTEPFDLLGYSLGARVALHLAFARPDRVRRLVLIGGTAGIEDPEARRARRLRDDALATELEESHDLGGFLRRWLAGPMFSGLRDPGMNERLRNTPGGLASSLRMAGAGTYEPLWNHLGDLTPPVLALAGADDPRYAGTGARIARSVRHGVFSLVPGAGHAAHLAQPDLAARMVTQFFSAMRK